MGDVMLVVDNVSLSFGGRSLFKEVNLKLTEGNCYGLIGANGAGKSTFLKILAKQIDTTKGEIFVTNKERISTLKQNHNEYNEYTLIDTVIMGNNYLYSVMKEKDALYMKEDFTDADGIKVGELETIFADLNGWQAESDAAILLSNLGISNSVHYTLMEDLKESDKVKVLLAQALFGDPEILLLDEPTNYLDMDAKRWLEEFLINYKNTVVVVSHDRDFLNNVCTHTLDIDFDKITEYIGNYDFWYESSQLLLQQMKDSNKKKEEKMEELKAFIARFSANASKSKQATSRKKLLEKIVLEDIKPSTRRYPYINFDSDRRMGREVLTIKSLSKKIDDVDILKNISMTLNPKDKLALVGSNELAKTIFLKILAGELEPDSGYISFGSTIKTTYFPKNHDSYFKNNLNLIEWLRLYSDNSEEAYIRSFLGRMLFSSDEALKKVTVLSGGEKVRCMFAKMMLEKGNLLLLDEPTNHLDIESITALNKGMREFNGCIIFASYDYELINTTANKILEFNENGTCIYKETTYEEFLKSKK